MMSVLPTSVDTRGFCLYEDLGSFPRPCEQLLRPSLVCLLPPAPRIVPSAAHCAWLTLADARGAG